VSKREAEPAMYGIVAGFLSCAALAVQIPWAFCVAMFAWGNARPGSVPTASDGIVLWIAILLPTIFALALGATSIVGAGLSSRNTAGLTGCTLAMIAVLVVIWHFCG
jgi:hypothetical protein